MLSLDPLILARIQFAANFSFHILFPSVTVALGWIVLFTRIKFHFSKEQKWLELFYFWSKFFALCFALGLISGTAISFQFGSNWPGFMQLVGNIAGPLLAFELFTAISLVVCFLSFMLTGIHRLAAKFHILCCFLVALGSTLSVFWVLVLNSWMHTPLGYVIYNGEAHATSWSNIIFNPSMPYRVVHTFIASGITVGFLMAGVGAVQLKYNKTHKHSLTNLKIGLFLAAILVPIQIFSGQLHLHNSAEHQPAKIAAIDGIDSSYPQSPYVAFPVLESPEKVEDIKLNLPPIVPVYYSFRVMVATGVLMLIMSWVGCISIFKNAAPPEWLIKTLIPMTFSGWVATVSGWYVTEIGRQPWLVQGLLKVDSAATIYDASLLYVSLFGYFIAYLFMIGGFIYFTRRFIRAPEAYFISQSQGQGHKHESL